MVCVLLALVDFCCLDILWFFGFVVSFCFFYGFLFLENLDHAKMHFLFASLSVLIR